MKRRLRSLTLALPSMRRRLAGGLMVLSCSLFSTLLAYAAAPSTPRFVPAKLAEALAPLRQAAQQALYAPPDTPATSRAVQNEIHVEPADPTLRDPAFKVFWQTPEDTIEARQRAESAMLAQLLAANGQPGIELSGTPLPLKKLNDLIGPGASDAFTANDNRLAVLREEKIVADAMARGDTQTVKVHNKEAVDGPDYFVIPEGMTSGQAAKAIGLVSDEGYTAWPVGPTFASGLSVRYKCYSINTPPDLGC